MSENVAAQQVVALVEWARKRFKRPAEDWQARPGETRAVQVVIRQVEEALTQRDDEIVRLQTELDAQYRDRCTPEKQNLP